MTDIYENQEHQLSDMESQYAGETTRITVAEIRTLEVRAEARRQLLEMLEPMSTMERQTANRLFWIISR